MKNLFKRLKSQKGMSGVLVSLLLVIVGVSLVAGISTYMEDAKKAVNAQATAKLSELNVTVNSTQD